MDVKCRFDRPRPQFSGRLYEQYEDDMRVWGLQRGDCRGVGLGVSGNAEVMRTELMVADDVAARMEGNAVDELIAAPQF